MVLYFGPVNYPELGFRQSQQGSCSIVPNLLSIHYRSWRLVATSRIEIVLMEEILRWPVEVGSVSSHLLEFLYIPSGCLGFLNHQQYGCFSTYRLVHRDPFNALLQSLCNWVVQSLRFLLMHQINLCPGGCGGLCWTTKLHPIGLKISGGQWKDLVMWREIAKVVFIYRHYIHYRHIIHNSIDIEKKIYIYIYILYGHIRIYIYIYMLQALQKEQVPNNERSWTLVSFKRGSQDVCCNQSKLT